MTQDKVSIVKNYDDDELIKYRYALDKTDANINVMESQRRLKEAIMSLDISTTRQNKTMIGLTRAIYILTGVGTLLTVLILVLK